MEDRTLKKPPPSREEVLEKLQRLPPADRLEILYALKALREERRLLEIEEHIAELKSRETSPKNRPLKDRQIELDL